MQKLTLAVANGIIEAALTRAHELKLSPICIVVLDEGGYLKAMQREDGASLIRPQIAYAKAWGAVSMGVSSRQLGKFAAERPQFMNALIGIAEGRMMPVPGGVLIRSLNQEILGSIGISGDLSERDEACAIFGITSLGLIADAGDNA